MQCGGAGEKGHFLGYFAEFFSIPYPDHLEVNVGLGECSLNQNWLKNSNLESDFRYEVPY